MFTIKISDKAYDRITSRIYKIMQANADRIENDEQLMPDELKRLLREINELTYLIRELDSVREMYPVNYIGGK